MFIMTSEFTTHVDAAVLRGHQLLKVNTSLLRNGLFLKGRSAMGTKTSKSPNEQPPPDASETKQQKTDAKAKGLVLGTAEKSKKTETKELVLSPDISFKSALIIQSWWRGLLVRRAVRQATICVLIIQRWWCRVACRLRDERRVRALVMYIWPEKATVLLQSMFRMWLVRTQYKRYQKAALVIQNSWQRYAYRRDSSASTGNNPADDGVDLNIEIVVG